VYSFIHIPLLVGFDVLLCTYTVHTSYPSAKNQVVIDILYRFLIEPEMATLIKVVVPRIAARWETVAHFLKFEISRIEIIKKQHPNDPEESCTKVFTHWLSTDDGVRPKTWETLLKTLNEIKQLTSATEEIKIELEKL